MSKVLLRREQREGVSVNYKVAEAVLSECMTYRYDLYRRWRTGEGYVLWVMLNPSTADGRKDDATIRKCRGFTTRLGYGAMHVVNLFAFRSTMPGELLSQSDPVGDHNDYHISLNSHRRPTCRLIIAAWGSLNFIPKASPLRGRVPRVLAMLANVHCLGTSKSGDPRHPSRIGYATPLVPFTLPEVR
jgi:hypothetical protein